MTIFPYEYRVKHLLTMSFDLFLFITSSIIIILSNKVNDISIIGTAVIFLSIYLCVKTKENEKLLFLFSIIAFINISLAVNDGILMGINVAPWQIPLRETVYNLYTMESILIFLATINLFISHNWLQKNTVNYSLLNVNRKENPIIAYVGSFAMYFILVLGYDTTTLSTSSYISNNNPLIEYAIVIYCIVWFYSKNSRLIFVSQNFYALIYILYSLSFGDRSASFLMILLYYLLYYSNKFKITLTKLFVLSLIAITLSNIIAEIRNDDYLSVYNLTSNVFERGLYSDTVSYSYYASITLSATYHLENTLVPFGEYLKSWIVGGGNSDFGNLAEYVKNKYLYNVGGGIYTSYFYFGFGYIGVILSTVVLGLILRGVYSNHGSFAVIYQILIPVLSVRWYLYGPTTLYRSIFIVSTILIFLCLVFHKLRNTNNKNVKHN